MSDGVETKTSSLMGSPFYMSPEQLTSVKTVDARSDIWALGVILYELTTGLTPFYAETMPEIVAAILSAAPKPVREVEPSLPQAVADVIHKCLLRDPKDRFANVGELANSLSEFSTGRSAKISAERISRVLGTESLASFGLHAPLSILGPSTGESKPPPPLSGGTSKIAEPRPSDANELKAATATKVVGASTAASWGAGSGTHSPLTDTDAKKKKPVLLVAGIVGACLVTIGAAAMMKKSDPPAGGSTGTTTTASVTTPATVTAPPSIEKLATPDPIVPVTVPGSATTAATPPTAATAATIKQPGRPTTTATAKATTSAPPPSATAAPPPSATAAKNPLQIQIK
jgi:serine/threonine-protein kinase